MQNEKKARWDIIYICRKITEIVEKRKTPSADDASHSGGGGSREEEGLFVA